MVKLYLGDCISEVCELPKTNTRRGMSVKHKWYEMISGHRFFVLTYKFRNFFKLSLGDIGLKTGAYCSDDRFLINGLLKRLTE